jgi:hypothetical protein
VSEKSEKIEAPLLMQGAFTLYHFYPAKILSLLSGLQDLNPGG